MKNFKKTKLINLILFVSILSAKSQTAVITGSSTASPMVPSNYTCTVNGLPNGVTISSYKWSTSFLGSNGTINGQSGNFIITSTNIASFKWDGSLSPASTWVDCSLTTSTGSLISASGQFVTIKGIGNISISQSAIPYIFNMSSIQYCITNYVDGDIFNWTYPSGWVVLSGAGSNCITLQPNSTSSGTVSCNVQISTATAGYSKTANFAVIRPVQPPNFITTTTEYCILTNATAQFCVSPVTGATDYFWTVSNGWYIAGNSNGTCITVGFNSKPQSGTICCRTNISGGGVSTYTCINIVVSGNIPIMPSAFIRTAISNNTCTSYRVGCTTVAGATSYEWCSGLSATCFSNQTNIFSTIQPIYDTYLFCDGPVNVCVRAKNICGVSPVKCGSVNIPCPSSCNLLKANKNNEIINQLVGEDFLTIYPNPSTQNFTIEFNANGENAFIKLISLDGEILREINTTQNSIELDMSNLPDGIFLVQVSQNGKYHTRRIAKIN